MKDLATRLNRHAPKSAFIHFDGAHAFGESTLRRWHLANGLKVLTMVDAAAPVVGYQTWLSVGSRDEVKGKTGLAHFFKHLMFNGTKNFPQGAFDARLEAAGAENNAATWTDWTQYYETLPASELSLVITLESDRMQHLELLEAQVASEREVVASERRDRVDDDVEGAANEALYDVAFRRHGYGHPTVGWMRDIERYSVADCVAFYRQYYAPSNACVVLVGDFEEEAALSEIQGRYGAIPKVKQPPRRRDVEPKQRKERQLEMSLPTHTQKLCLGYKGPALADPDWRALSVLGDVLFGGRSSRVHRALVLDEEIAVHAYGTLAPFEHEGLYEIWVGLREGKVSEEALRVLDDELERIKKDGVSDRELEKAKARAELGLLSSMDSVSGRAEQVGFDETVLGDPAASLKRLEAYRGLNAEDIKRVARTYFDTKRRTVVHVREGL